MEKNTSILLQVRALFLGAAFLIPLSGYLIEASSSDAIESMLFSVRIVLGVFFGFLFVGSLFIAKIKRYHILLSRISLYVMAAYLFVFAYSHNLNLLICGMSAILMASSPLFFLDWKRFFPFFIFNVVISVIGVFLFMDSENSLAIFILVQTFGFVLSVLGLSALNNFLSTLKLTDKIIANADALILTSNEKGEIIFVSENVTKILGYRREEILGMGWWMIRNSNTDYDENDLFNYAEQMRKKHKSDSGGYDAPIKTANGDTKWFHWKVVFLKDGHSVGIGQDITEGKKAKDEAKKLSLITQNTDNIVILTDPSDRIEWINPAFTSLTGYTLQEVKDGKPSSFLAGKRTNMELLQNTARGVHLKKKVHFNEFEFYRKNGDSFWCSLNFTPMFDDLGNVQNIIAVGRDITEEIIAKQKIEVYSDRLKALHNLDRSILVADSIEEVFQATLNSIHAISVNLIRVSISMFNHDDDVVQILSKNTALDEDDDVITSWDRTFLPISDFKNLMNTFKDAAYLIQDLINAEQDYFTNFQKDLVGDGVGSYVSIPIKHENDVLGSVNFGAKSADIFTPDTVDFLLELTQDISSAVYQSKLKQTISSKTNKLEQKNKDISDSIRYAERIQKGMFPSESYIESKSKDSFVLFKPKDGLSGDFYFFENNKNALWFAAADCTGHGVPGALVSIVAHNILTEAIFTNGIEGPGEVLEYLSLKIKERLSNEETQTKDGLDIGLCKLDLNTKELSYCGAMNNLYITSNGVLKEYKAVRRAIGADIDDFSVSYKDQKIQLNDNDKLYLFSDGFVDQFGGEFDKKFGSRKFKNLIEEISSYKMSEQKRILENSLSLWMKEREQVDDIVIFGLEF